MSYQWYALRSKSRKEDAVWRQLQTQGFEVFYPCLRVLVLIGMGIGSVALVGTLIGHGH